MVDKLLILGDWVSTSQVSKDDIKSVHEFQTTWNDLSWGQNETVPSSVPHFEGVGQVGVHDSFDMISATTTGNIQKFDNISWSEVSPVSRSNCVSGSRSDRHVSLMIWNASPVRPVGNEDELTVAVETEIEDEVIAKSGDECGRGGNFRLREGADTHERIAAGHVAGTTGIPIKGKIPVWICPSTRASGCNASCLSPHAVA